MVCKYLSVKINSLVQQHQISTCLLADFHQDTRDAMKENKDPNSTPRKAREKDRAPEAAREEESDVFEIGSLVPWMQLGVELGTAGGGRWWLPSRISLSALRLSSLVVAPLGLMPWMP